MLRLYNTYRVAAKFNVDVKGYTAEDEDLVCVKLKVDFMKNPFPHLAW